MTEFFHILQEATGIILGRFGKALMSKSEDLPAKRAVNGSCRCKASQDMGTLYVVAPRAGTLKCHAKVIAVYHVIVFKGLDPVIKAFFYTC